MASQQHFPGADILPNLAHMLPGDGSLADHCPALGKDHLLHHDDGIPILGQGVAGIHHGILLREERDRGGVAGAEGIRCTDGDAVHGAGGVVGGADMGVHRPCGDPAPGSLDRDPLPPGSKARLPQQGQVLAPGLIQRPVVEILKSHALPSIG